jgi:hypothetical protein
MTASEEAILAAEVRNAAAALVDLLENEQRRQ